MDPARWQSVAANLGASAEQQAQVRASRDQHAARLQALQAQRQTLSSAAQAAASRSDNKQVCMPTVRLVHLSFRFYFCRANQTSSLRWLVE